MRRVLPTLALSLLPTLAHAEFPERISVWAMEDFHGARSEAIDGDDFVTTGWKEVTLDLGSTISNKPNAPARTLGAAGFHMGLNTIFAHLPSRWVERTSPDGWELMDPDEEAAPLLVLPGIQLRKGLPASLEVGANFGWLGGTETAFVGGFGRWGIVEGYRNLPDVSVQVGYAGYVGNDEFELGALDMSTSIGYSLSFGPIPGIHTAKFSPFINLGLTRIHAAPRVNLTGSRLDGRVPEVSGFEGATFSEPFAPFTFAGGFEVQSGQFTFDLTSGYAVGAAVNFNLGLGFTY